MQSDFRSSYRVPGGHILTVEREGRTITISIDGEPEQLNTRAAVEEWRDAFNSLAQDIHQQIERAHGPYPD